MTPLTACGHPSQSFTKSWPSTTPELWTCPLPCLVQGGPWAGHPEVFSHLFGTTILSCLSLPGHLPEPCLTSASVSTSVKRGCVHPHAGAPTLREQGCHRGPCTPRIIRTAKRRCWGQAPWGECSVPLPPTWCGVGSGGPSTDARGGPGNPSCPTLWIRVTLPAGGLGKPCSHCYPGGGHLALTWVLVNWSVSGLTRQGVCWWVRASWFPPCPWEAPGRLPHLTGEKDELPRRRVGPRLPPTRSPSGCSAEA